MRTDVSHDDLGIVVELSGELDLHSVAALQRELDLVEDGDGRLLLDLGDLRYIDGTGISALVQAQKRADERGRQMAVRAPRPAVWRLLKIFGLPSLFAIEDAGDESQLHP